jgi:alpha-glucosidase
VHDTDETPQGPLQLRVYPGPDCTGSIYADDGKSFNYNHGDFYRNRFTCEASTSSLRVTIGPGEGKFNPWWKSYSILAVDAEKIPSSVTMNGQPVKNFKYVAAQKTLSVEVPVSQNATEIVIQY